MLEKFRYTLPDGYVIVLPRMEDVPLGVIRKTRKLEQGDQVFSVLEMLLSEEALEHVDLLGRADFEPLMVKWREASQVELGESSASSMS